LKVGRVEQSLISRGMLFQILGARGKLSRKPRVLQTVLIKVSRGVQRCIAIEQSAQVGWLAGGI